MVARDKSRYHPHLVSTQALGRHALWRHLDLPGIAQCKPGLVHWACSWQAQAALDGARGREYPTPFLKPEAYLSNSIGARLKTRQPLQTLYLKLC